jgi:hypothetical protein
MWTLCFKVKKVSSTQFICNINLVVSLNSIFIWPKFLNNIRCIVLGANIISEAGSLTAIYILQTVK